MSEPKEPSIPLSTVVDWLNEHAARADEEAEMLQLADEVSASSEKPVSPVESTRRERQLGGLVAKQSLLKDFSGLLEAQTYLARDEADISDEPSHE